MGTVIKEAVMAQPGEIFIQIIQLLRMDRVSKPYDPLKQDGGTANELLKFPPHCFLIHLSYLGDICHPVIGFRIHKQINTALKPVQIHFSELP